MLDPDPLVLLHLDRLSVLGIIQLGSFFNRDQDDLAWEDHMQVLDGGSDMDFFIRFDEDLIGGCLGRGGR